MRPNTPHAVFSPEHTICHGGHFYATTTMRDTMFAIVHTFVSPHVLTNTDHPSHGILLRRIAAFYHEALVQKRLEDGSKCMNPSCVPNPLTHRTFLYYFLVFRPGHVPQITDFDSLLNLLTFCNLVIMANVLDSRTYEKDPGASDSVALSKHDANAIPVKERYAMAYARGRCWDILFWVFHKYEVFDKETGEMIDGFSQVAMRYLAHLGSTIIEFKRRSVESQMDPELFTVKALTRQVKHCFKSYDCDDVLPMEPSDAEGVASLAFPDEEKYGVRASVSPKPFSRKYFPLKLNTLSKRRPF